MGILARRPLRRRKTAKSRVETRDIGEPSVVERRREARFAISTYATIETLHDRRVVSATTVDLSGGGVRLKLEDGARLNLGDKVLCEFKILNAAEASLPFWGVGTVVRIGDDWAAVHFEGGGFSE